MAKTKTEKPIVSEIMVPDAFSVSKNELTKLAADYSNLVVTEETYEASLKARATLRDSRYSIQNTEKDNDKKRIEWNKKTMSSNAAKAKELIDIIFPVEDEIDIKIKAIEAEWLKEKEAKAAEAQLIINARIKAIADTGAVIVESGYLLDDQFISHEEIKLLPDTQFDKCVTIFQNTQAEMQAKIEAERQRLADLDLLIAKQKAEEKAKLEADQAELKKQQDAFKAEQEKVAKESEERRAGIDAEIKRIEQEKAKIEEEKRQLVIAKIQNRQASLLRLGMKLNGKNYSFNNDEVIVAFYDIEDATDEQWNKILTQKTSDIIDVKTRIEQEVAAQKTKDAEVFELKQKADAERSERLKSDIERLDEWVKTFRFDTINPEGLSDETMQVCIKITDQFTAFQESIIQTIQNYK